MSEVTHRYKRPDWTCLTDGEPWPCAARRAAFLEKYDGQRMRLRGILGIAAHDAKQDLGLSHEETHERFIAWTLQPWDVVVRPPHRGGEVFVAGDIAGAASGAY